MDDDDDLTDDQWADFCEANGLPFSDVEEMDLVLEDEGLEMEFHDWLEAL